MKFEELINHFYPEFQHENIFYAETGVNPTHANWGKLIARLRESIQEENRRFILCGEENEHYSSKAQEDILAWCHPKNDQE